MKNLVVMSAVLLLAACASPYEIGKSPADVPAHVNAVYLKKVYMVGRWHQAGDNGVDPQAKGDPAEEQSPSQNDQEVTALAKANIVSELTNLGYTPVQNSNAAADIAMEFFVDYQPEDWPLIDRSVFITGRAYDMDGTPLFTANAFRNNAFGLIGAVVGDSRDEMVSAAARDAVVKVVDEMRKGTKENIPVSSQTASHEKSDAQGTEDSGEE